MLLRLIALSCLWTGSLVGQQPGSWIELPLATRPLPRERHSMVFDTERGESVLYGGSSGGLLDDTWTLDQSGWTQRSTPVSPSGRHRAAMAFDPIRGKTVLFGGSDGSPLDDIWEWDGSSWQLVASGVPGVGDDGNAAFDPIRGGILYGLGSFNGLWDGVTMQTLNVANPGNFDGEPMVFVASAGGVIRRSGRGTFRFETPFGWRELAPSSNLFNLRNYALAHDPIRDVTLLQGGDGSIGSSSGNGMGRTWQFNGSFWGQTNVGDPFLSRHAMVFDTVRGTFVMFGGFLNGIPRLIDRTYIWQPDLAPAQWSEFGFGCSGTSSSTPRLEADPAWSRAPVLGGFWFVRLVDLPGSSPVAGIVGLSNTSYLGVPLPIDLGVAGMPGCSLLVAPDAVSSLGISSAAGTASWVTEIPDDAALAGLEIFQQAAALMPTANPTGVVWSNAGRGVLGS